MEKKEKSWQQIAEEAELWSGHLVRPVSINTTAQGNAIMSRIVAECQEKDQRERAQGVKLKEPEAGWKEIAMEYAKVSQESARSINVIQTAGYDADLARLGKGVKKKEKEDKKPDS